MGNTWMQTEPAAAGDWQDRALPYHWLRTDWKLLKFSECRFSGPRRTHLRLMSWERGESLVLGLMTGVPGDPGVALGFEKLSLELLFQTRPVQHGARRTGFSGLLARKVLNLFWLFS